MMMMMKVMMMIMMMTVQEKEESKRKKEECMCKFVEQQRNWMLMKNTISLSLRLLPVLHCSYSLSAFSHYPSSPPLHCFLQPFTAFFLLVSRNKKNQWSSIHLRFASLSLCSPFYPVSSFSLRSSTNTFSFFSFGSLFLLNKYLHSFFIFHH